MIKEWAEDIRIKTKDMSREQKTEYVLNYYWYHILLGTLALGLLVLGIYHVTWGKRHVEFSLVLVNQDINYARDEKICDDFADISGIAAEDIQVDSDYLISYDDVKLDGVNESSYEKLFFNWSSGGIDAIIMPESFYHYCKRQGGEFMDPEKLLAGESCPAAVTPYKDGGACTGIYADQISIAGQLKQNAADPLILVFPSEMQHKDAAGQFLRYVFESCVL